MASYLLGIDSACCTTCQPSPCDPCSAPTIYCQQWSAQLSACGSAPLGMTFSGGAESGPCYSTASKEGLPNPGNQQTVTYSNPVNDCVPCFLARYLTVNVEYTPPADPNNPAGLEEIHITTTYDPITCAASVNCTGDCEDQGYPEDYTIVTTVSDYYSDAMLKANFATLTPTWPSQDPKDDPNDGPTEGGCTASYEFTPAATVPSSVTGTWLRYQIGAVIPAGGASRVTWTELLTPDDGSATTSTARSWTLPSGAPGTMVYSDDYTIAPPTVNGTITISDLQYAAA